MPHAPLRIRLLSAAAIFVATLMTAPAAHAQPQCTFPWDGQQTANGCEVPPQLFLSPLDLTTSQPSVPFTVHARDFDGGLVDSTFQVRVNNVVQSGMWVQEVPGPNGWINREFWQRGVAPLSAAAPTATVWTRVCDVHSYLHLMFCPEQQVTFTLSVPGVEVAPKGWESPAPRAPHRQNSFTVTNRGTAAATFVLTPECRDENRVAVSPCSVSQPTLTLLPGQAAAVPVTYWVDRPGAIVWVKLGAHAQGSPVIADAGWMDITVNGTSEGSPAAPAVQLVDLNSGTTVVRSQCVTVAAGPGAAYECGDLRLAHAMPAVRWRGRVRPAVLLYNSQHADPYSTVYADVRVPEGTLRPDSIHVVVTMNGVVRASKSYRGVDFAPGTTRRVAVAWSARDAVTDVYPYQMQVTSRFGATTLSTTTPGELVIVNRRTSPFGAGWWLAGLEQIVIPSHDPSTRLWIGGDGSTRLYRPVPGVANTWMADAVDRPEVLEYEFAGYSRALPSGGLVHYHPDGRHDYTRNSLRQHTYFTYDPATLRVQEVTIAYTGVGTAPRYTLRYDAQGRLSVVDANIPGQPDSVQLSYGTERRITSITDPDGAVTQLQYTYSSRPYSPTVRTGRSSTPVRYTFGHGGRLSSVRMPLDSATTDSSITSFDAAESKGIAASYLLSQVYTRLDGPRADVEDVTWLWLTRWGAPERIRDALGRETLIERTAAFPALATAVTTPGGLRSSAAYDARGRVEFQVVHDPFGDGLNDTTRYTYDDRWNAITRVSRQRGPGGQVLLEDMTIAYDSVGNRSWVQQGNDPARRVHFTYVPANLPGERQVRTVRTPTAAGVAVDSVAYDAMGNVVLTRSPLGFLTRIENDAAGRPTLVVSPTDSASARTIAGLNATGMQRHVRYDALGRDTLSWTVGPAMLTAGAQTVYVRTQYHPGGAVKQVSRWSDPDPADIGVVTTSYRYDRAGRKVEERDPVQTQRFGYDPAGNATSWTTGRGHVITTHYDALGRVVRREVPAVSYAGSCVAGAPGSGGGGDPPPLPSDSMELPESMEDPSSGGTCIPFPYYPNAGSSGLTIPAEWTYFRYDAAGNMVEATNGDAVVTRAYYPNGALRTDRTAIRSFGGYSFGTHAYQLEYRYDRLGRVDSLQHPVNLTDGVPRYATYTYDVATGALAGAADRDSVAFSFVYDAAGRMTHSYGPGGLVEGITYDLDGRRRTRDEHTSQAQLHLESFRYDARGKLLSAFNGQSEFQQWYSGLGMLTQTDWMNHGANQARMLEEFQVDALGNAAWRRSGEGINRGNLPSYATTYQPGTGQVVRVEKEPPLQPTNQYSHELTTRSYDASGNMTHGMQEYHGSIPNSVYTGPVRIVNSRSYYAADERLRYFQESDVSAGSAIELRGVWEEYRYDPLGRRILVHSNRNHLCGGSEADCTSHVTRMVWSGDQLLWELRARAGVHDDPNAESTSGELYGVVSYTHATGIDRPLAIHKRGQPVIIPHENWRGQFARGTYTDGRVSDCPESSSANCTRVAWPGYRTTAWHMEAKAPDVVTWYGGLVDGMRDASGQMYMRNRYYDPATGQFTQPDPIGLAGGLNAYGFAAGDPVSYADPYGLSADTIGFIGDENAGKRIWNAMVINAKTTLRLGTRPEQLERAREFLGELMEMWESSETFLIDVRDHPAGTAAHALGGHEFRREDGAYVVQIDLQPANVYRASFETRLAHELGGALGRSQGRGHDGPSVEMENLYRDARGGCPRRRDHSYRAPMCQ